jgi:hypothetical protein
VKGRGSDFSAFSLPVLIDDDSCDDDHAFYYLLVVGIDPQEREAGRHDTEDDCADNGAGDSRARSDMVGRRDIGAAPDQNPSRQILGLMVFDRLYH